MILHKILVGSMGLAAFASGICLMMWSKFSFYWPLTLMGITGVIFALLGLEFLHYGLSPHDKYYRFFSRGFRGLFFDLLHLSLASLLMFSTVIYQRSSDPLCGGGLSGGFPLAFLCDNAGESPIDDWGKITWTIDRPNLLGAFGDALFYLALLWIIYFMALRIIQQVKQDEKTGFL